MNDKTTAEKPELSIVIPVFNEEECLPQLFEELKAALGRLECSSEVLFVDDGSTDASPELLRQACADVPEFHLVRFASNCGQSAAFTAGFRKARGEVVVTLDADLQNDPADIPLLLDALKNADCVCGWRQKRMDSFVRRVSSKIANGFRNWMTNESIHDVGCSLKAFRRETLENLVCFNGMHRFLPTLVRLQGYSVIEVKVNHRPRLAGKSKYGIRNRLFRGIRDVMGVRWLMKRWIRYEIAEEL